MNHVFSSLHFWVDDLEVFLFCFVFDLHRFSVKLSEVIRSHYTDQVSGESFVFWVIIPAQRVFCSLQFDFVCVAVVHSERGEVREGSFDPGMGPSSVTSNQA